MKVKVLGLVAMILISATSFAQSKYGATAEDSVSCVMNYSLYSEYMKQKEYNDAVKGWREVMVTCPKLSKNTFINGARMYKSFIKAEDDAVKKSALVDTLFWVFDQRIIHFGQEGKVLEYKGSSMMKYRKDSTLQANAIMKRAKELLGNDMSATGAYSYYKSIYLMAKKKQATKDDLIMEFAGIIEIVDYNIANATSDKKKDGFVKAKANIEKIFIGVAKCDDLIAFYAPKFEATPNDTVMLKNIVRFLDKQECTEDKLYEAAASKLCEVSPSYDCAMALGKLLSKQDDYGTALGYFKNAVENATTDEQKVDANLRAAQCSYNLKSFSNVRMYCRAIIAVNPNHGGAYLLIGDAYSASASKCGDNECTKKSAYWAAVDKYARAKNVDATVADKANKKIAAASAQFPKKTDCFFHSINEGDSFTVGCWINETTKVRVRE